MKLFNICPVLAISADDLDYVHQPQALEVVVGCVQERLGDGEETDLRSG